VPAAEETAAVRAVVAAEFDGARDSGRIEPALGFGTDG
jgi:hypothetical protein